MDLLNRRKLLQLGVAGLAGQPQAIFRARPLRQLGLQIHRLDRVGPC